MTDGPGIEAALADAIADVLARHERSMTTKWVTLIETLDENGGRGLWTFTSEGATAWDTLGLLTFAVQMEQTKAICHHEEQQ